MHLKHALKNLVHWWNQSSYPDIMLFLWIPIIAPPFFFNAKQSFLFCYYVYQYLTINSECVNRA